jgi:hypothetical protein
MPAFQILPVKKQLPAFLLFFSGKCILSDEIQANAIGNDK